MQYFEYCCEAILLHYRGECRQIQIENIESREYFWSLCICDYQRKILLKFHRQLIPRKFVWNIAIKSKLLSRQWAKKAIQKHGKGTWLHGNDAGEKCWIHFFHRLQIEYQRELIILRRWHLILYHFQSTILPPPDWNYSATWKQRPRPVERKLFHSWSHVRGRRCWNGSRALYAFWLFRTNQ